MPRTQGMTVKLLSLMMSTTSKAMETLIVLQIVLHHCSAAFDALQKSVGEVSVDIALTQEPLARKNVDKYYV